MTKRKEKIFLPKADLQLSRIPQELWQSYRKRGGPHGTPKGEKGYSRQKEKQKARGILKEAMSNGRQAGK